MKVKVLSAKNGYIHISIDGVPHTYLVTRPQPLTEADRAMLDPILDAAIMRGMLEVVRPVNPIRDLFEALTSRFRRRVPDVLFIAPVLANYIRREAIQLEIEGQHCYVVTPDMLSKIEKGVLA